MDAARLRDRHPAHPTGAADAAAARPHLRLRARAAPTAFPKQGERDPWRLRAELLHRPPRRQRAPIERGHDVRRPRCERTVAAAIGASSTGSRAVRVRRGAPPSSPARPSGIGEELAHALAVRGSDLVLLDRDGAGSARGGRDPRPHRGSTVETIVVDLADRTRWTRWRGRSSTRTRRSGCWSTTRASRSAGLFDQLTLEEFEWVMDINFRAPIRLTHHLLPALTARPGGHLVNVSSLFGLIAPPGQSAYSRASSRCAGSARRCAPSCGCPAPG